MDVFTFDEMATKMAEQTERSPCVVTIARGMEWALVGAATDKHVISVSLVRSTGVHMNRSFTLWEI